MPAQKVTQAQLQTRFTEKAGLDAIAAEFGLTVAYVQYHARRMGFKYYLKPAAELAAIGAKKAEMRRLRKTGMSLRAIGIATSSHMTTIKNAIYKYKEPAEALERPLSPAMLNLAKYDPIIAQVARRQKEGEGADAAPLPPSYPSRAINSNLNFATQRPVSRYSWPK